MYFFLVPWLNLFHQLRNSRTHLNVTSGLHVKKETQPPEGARGQYKVVTPQSYPMNLARVHQLLPICSQAEQRFDVESFSQTVLGNTLGGGDGGEGKGLTRSSGGRGVLGR